MIVCWLTEWGKKWYSISMEEMMRRYKNIPFVSAVLVIVNIIVFLICTFTGDLLYNMGGVDRWSVVIQQDFGRLLWAMFLHVDIAHLFNNMLILFFLGSMIEKEIGHIRYAVIYFLSGVGGNVLSVAVKALTGDNAVSVGASGAVFGLDGLLLAMVLFSRKFRSTVTPRRVVLMILLSLYGGFTGGNIDNAAHVGGLIVGFVCGGIMCAAERDRKTF